MFDLMQPKFSKRLTKTGILVTEGTTPTSSMVSSRERDRTLAAGASETRPSTASLLYAHKRVSSWILFSQAQANPSKILADERRSI
jgi:hypothetical protein